MTAPLLICALGLSHRTATVGLRERIAFGEQDLRLQLPPLLWQTRCREAVLLSTCNRMEVYAAGEGPEGELAARLRAYVAAARSVPEAEFAGALYAHYGAEAVRHLFEVAASLDSQILGETEILAQTREAFRRAEEAGTVGPVLRALFDRAFSLAKDVRGEGGIGEGQASLSTAAVQLGEKIFDTLRGHVVLVLGTGEMAAGMLRALRTAGAGEIWVAGRSAERAEAFARTAGGRCVELAALGTHLGRADIVLVSTAAPHYILRPEHVAEARHARRGRPLFIVDISVPRNVDPAVQGLPDTYLYDIDDLEEVTGETRRQREAAAARWRPCLAGEAQRFINELNGAGTGSAAKQLLERAADLRRIELERLRARGNLDAAALAELEQVLERFQAKLLHGPLSALKEAARAGDGQAAALWAARLFHLPAAEAGEEATPPEAGGGPSPDAGGTKEEREPRGTPLDPGPQTPDPRP